MPQLKHKKGFGRVYFDASDRLHGEPSLDPPDDEEEDEEAKREAAEEAKFNEWHEDN